MWKKNRQDKKKQHQAADQDYSVKDIPLTEVKRAIREYSSQLSHNFTLSVIINEDLTLDYSLLAPFLDGIPKQTYYMSKETYELFEEMDYQLAIDIDTIQKAVDKYMTQKQTLPILENDPYKKVNYLMLEKLNLLSYRPNRDFFITNEEYLVTYEKPS